MEFNTVVNSDPFVHQKKSSMVTKKNKTMACLFAQCSSVEKFSVVGHCNPAMQSVHHKGLAVLQL